MQTYDVVIPCFNGADTVAAAMQSALSCAGVVAVIVVDDGSTDDSVAMVGAVDDERVCVEYQPNGGPGSARNRGAALGTADRLIFLDADDVLLPGATRVFEAFASAKLVRTGVVRVFPDGSEETRFAISDPRPFPRGAPLPGTFAISRKLFDRIGGYDERLRYGENTELLLRAGQAMGGMHEVSCEPRPTVRAGYVPGRNSQHYRRNRIDSIQLVRTTHPRLLRQDAEMRRDYFAIASVLLRAEGDYRASAQAAFRAAVTWPPEGRSWVRALRSVAEWTARRPVGAELDGGATANSMGDSRRTDPTMETMSDELTAFGARLAVRFGGELHSFDGLSDIAPEVGEDAVVVLRVEHLRGLTDSSTVSITKMLDRAALVLLELVEHHDQPNSEELAKRLAEMGLEPEFVGRLPEGCGGSLAIIRGSRLPAPAPAPDEFRVVAIMTAYNERDIVRPSIERLIASGIDVYLIDNWSDDDTVAQVEDLVGHGLLAIEQFPPGGRVDHFEWSGLLERVGELAATLDHDWCVHHDVDQRRESPWPGLAYRDALHTAQQWGYNAVDHTILEFRPVDDGFADGAEISDYHRFFEFVPGAATAVHVQAWKNTGVVVDLAGSGGHDAAFFQRRVFPLNFVLRHYSVRSQQHGERKVFNERKPRYSTGELNRGWHSHYARMRQDHQFIRNPGDLIEWGHARVMNDYLLPVLGQIGMRFPEPTGREILRKKSIRLIQRLGLGSTWVRVRNSVRQRFA